MGRLDGRVALVTGAGCGFGRAIALAFGREGADLAVNYNASGAGRKRSSPSSSASAAGPRRCRPTSSARTRCAPWPRHSRQEHRCHDAGPVPRRSGGGLRALLCTEHALRPMVAARYSREAFTRTMAHEFGPHGVTVEDVAYCALFLAADAAHYLTGQVLQPHDGWVMA